MAEDDGPAARGSADTAGRSGGGAGNDDCVADCSAADGPALDGAEDRNDRNVTLAISVQRVESALEIGGAREPGAICHSERQRGLWWVGGREERSISPVATQSGYAVISDAIYL